MYNPIDENVEDDNSEVDSDDNSVDRQNEEDKSSNTRTTITDKSLNAIKQWLDNCEQETHLSEDEDDIFYDALSSFTEFDKNETKPTDNINENNTKENEVVYENDCVDEDESLDQVTADLEDLSFQNHSHMPFRDVHGYRQNTCSTVTPSVTSSTFDPRYVKHKVKKELKKKTQRQKAQLTKKSGENFYVNKKRRDRDYDIKDTVNGLWGF